MSQLDLIQRFYFHDQPIRGAVIKLNNSFIQALNGHEYPPALASLIGECLAATALMGVNLKRSAKLSLQARGNGSVKLLMAETEIRRALETNTETDDEAVKHTIRAVAKLSQHSHPDDPALHQPTAPLPALLGKANLAITIDPADGERYQGIVSLTQESLANCLQDYFTQSEQLATYFQLTAVGQQAAGLMLQRMPDDRGIETGNEKQHIQQLWAEVIMLASTLTDRELIQLTNQELLYRLFNEHPLNLSASQAIQFECSCSQQRTGQALMHIDPREVETILDEDGEIIMDCEFCSARYRFSPKDIERLISAQQQTRH